MPDFQRPTPMQLLLDMKTHCLEKGKRYNENEMRQYVNDEFESNGWHHPDIPLLTVRHPETFAEDPKRAELIRRDDAEAKAEIERIKAQAHERESERLSNENAQAAELRRAAEENRELRARLAALENGGPVTPPSDPTPPVVGAPIVPDGVPNDQWTMKELEEFAAANSIPLPESGQKLNLVGRPAVLNLINDVLKQRNDPRLTPEA